MGGWEILTLHGPTTCTITDGTRIKTVHVNIIQPRTQLSSLVTNTGTTQAVWEAPSIEHYVIEVDLLNKWCYLHITENH